MQCPRIDHFVRFNLDGTVTCCGHMTNPQGFQTYEELVDSAWLAEVRDQLEKDQWPNECLRCKQTEEIGQGSIRLNSLKLHAKQSKSDYLLVGGVLDNTCNSACQTCTSRLSTLIGKLDKTNHVVNNSEKFWQLPLDRVVQLDINGGEPSVSDNYKRILDNLPENVKSLRLNTNCNVVLKDELIALINKGVSITVTVSLDGIGKIHDYVRWPVKWDRFYTNLMAYKSMPLTLNTWTTVSALNIGNFQKILDFVEHHNLDHSWAFLQTPDPLNVKYKNSFTEVEVPEALASNIGVDRNNQKEIDSYILLQDSMRKIDYRNFYEDSNYRS